MRFLHSADWHLGRTLHGTSLLEDQTWVLDEFVRLAAEVRPHAVLLAGDIFDRAVPPVAAVRLLDSVLTRLVRELGIAVVMIAGNHDGPDRLAFGAELLSGSGLKVRGALDDADPVLLHDEHGAVAIHALPFADPLLARAAFSAEGEAAAEIDSHQAALALQLARARRRQPAGVRSVVLAHAFVAGGEECESERALAVGGSGAVATSLFDGFDYVALGHLHRAQQVGEARLHYAGSLLKYSFDEAQHRKSVNLVELAADGSCQVERIALPVRRDLRILDGELDALLAAAADDPARDDYVLARLRDRGALLDAMGKLRQVYPNALAIERPGLFGEGRAGDASDYRGIRVQDLFASFHQQTTGQALDEAGSAAVERLLERLDREERSA